MNQDTSIRHMYPNVSKITQSDNFLESMSLFKELKPKFEKIKKFSNITEKESFIMINEMCNQQLGFPYSKPFVDRANDLLNQLEKRSN